MSPADQIETVELFAIQGAGGRQAHQNETIYPAEGKHQGWFWPLNIFSFSVKKLVKSKQIRIDFKRDFTA